MKSRWYLLLLMALAAVLRLTRISAGQLWYDEVFSATLARLPFDRTILATAGDTHPPAYYLMLRGFSGLEPAEFWLRLPSVIFGVLLVAVIYLALTDLPSPARWGAAIATAIMPVMVWYGQEARMYAMLALVVWATYLALRSGDLPAFGVGLSLMCWTHNYGLFYAAALGMVALQRAYPDRQAIHRVLITGLLAFVSWIPWMIALGVQMQQLEAGYWIQDVTPGSILYSVWMQFTGFTVPERWQPLSVIVVYMLLIPALIWVLRRARPGNTEYDLLLIGLGPLVMAVLISLVYRPVLLFRGLLPSGPALYAMIALWLTHERPAWRAKTIYASALALPVIVACLYGIYVYGPDNRGTTRQEVALLDGGPVIHQNDSSALLYSWYAPDLLQYRIADCGQMLGQLSPLTRQAMAIMPEVSALPRHWVYLVQTESPVNPECELETIDLIQDQAEVVYERGLEDELISVRIWRHK